MHHIFVVNFETDLNKKREILLLKYVHVLTWNKKKAIEFHNCFWKNARSKQEITSRKYILLQFGRFPNHLIYCFAKYMYYISKDNCRCNIAIDELQGIFCNVLSKSRIMYFRETICIEYFSIVNVISTCYIIYFVSLVTTEYLNNHFNEVT